MKNKIGRVLISLAIAFGLWFYVISTVSPGYSDTVSNIPVVLDGEANLQERGLMVTDISASTVSLRLYGNRSDMIKLTPSNTTVRVDLAKVWEAGSQVVSYYPVFPTEMNNSSMTMQEGSPAAITLTISRKIVKEIPVEVKWIGSAKEGFITDRENRVLDNPVITISGPEETVNQIDKAIIEVDLNGHEASISDFYRFTLVDQEEQPVDSEKIVASVDQIRLDVKIQQVKDVNLVYKLVEGGGAKAENAQVKLSVSTIRVSGSGAALDALGGEMNIGSINLAEITKNTTLTFPLAMPEGITNLTGAAEVTAEVKLVGLSTKDFTLTAIQPINIPDGKQADVITESLTVSLRGPSDQIAKMTAKNIGVTVDLSAAELGTSTYKAIVQISEEFSNVGVLRADPISVSLSEE